MATKLYGINLGQNEYQVNNTAGPATTARNFEINIDLAFFKTSADVLVALDVLKAYIVKKFPT